MSGQKSFEDTFDHDPNAVYEEEEEEDFGRDDEFKDLPLPEPPPEKEQKSSYKINRKRKRSNAEDDSAAPSVPGGLMKYVLFALAVTAAYLYMQSPDEVKKAALQTVRKNIITETGDKKDSSADSTVAQTKNTAMPDWLKAYVASETSHQKNIAKEETPVSEKTRRLTKDLTAGEKVLKPTFPPPPDKIKEEPSLLLNLPVAGTALPSSKARGLLPSLSAAMQQNDDLQQTVKRISQMTLNETDIFRDAVKNMIYQWADVDNIPDSDSDYSKRKTAIVDIIRTTPPKMIKVFQGNKMVDVVDESVPLPEPPPALTDEGVAEEWNRFSNEIFYDVFAQSILKNSGVKSAYFENAGKVSFEESTLQIMADLYPLLEQILPSKPNKKEKMKTIEPVSSFLLKSCGSDMECLASYDMLMETLGFSPEDLKILQDKPLSVYDD